MSDNKQLMKGITNILKEQHKRLVATLPKHLNSDRMLRIIMNEFRKTPKLMECTQKSIVGAILQAGQLGLEPGGALGHAYLIPYKGECQFMIGYKGMIDLARRSGQIVSLTAQAVYENDEFDFAYGIEQKLHHKPTREERGNIIAAYAIAHLVGGGYQFEVMFKNEIDKIKKMSKMSSSGPWVEHYDEMARKTAVRRLFKYLPVSIEMANAVTLDEEADRGEQNNSLIIEGDYAVDEDTGEITNKETEAQTKSDKIAEELEKKNKVEDAEKVAKENFGE